LTVEQVAERVGYVDTTALRRLMRKVTGADAKAISAGSFAPNVTSQATQRERGNLRTAIRLPEYSTSKQTWQRSLHNRPEVAR